MLDETAASWSGHLKVVKINVDEYRQRASDFGVTSIPTLIFFKEGQAVERMTGWIPASQLSLKIEGLVERDIGALSTSRWVNGTQ